MVLIVHVDDDNGMKLKFRIAIFSIPVDTF